MTGDARCARTHARWAGFLYLYVLVAFVFGELATSNIRGSGAFPDLARRVLASEQVYRLALSSIAVGVLGALVLAFTLYVALEPVDRRLARLALVTRLGEAILVGAVLVLRFAAPHLYAAARADETFGEEQLQMLGALFARVQGSGVHLWLMCFGLGSTLTFVLFRRSRYIPRPLAGLGVLASVLVMGVSLGSLVLPEYAGTLQYGWGPLFVAQVLTGFWLLLRGVRPEPRAVARA